VHVHFTPDELDLDICQRLPPAAAPVIRGSPFRFSRNLRKRGCRAVWPKTLFQVVFGRNNAIIRENTTQIKPHSDCQCEYLTPELTASQILCVFARRESPVPGPTLTNHDPIARRRRLVPRSNSRIQTPEQSRISITTFAL
jgi:hypothetical protein